MHGQNLSKSNGSFASSFSYLCIGHFIVLKMSLLLQCFLKRAFYLLQYLLIYLRLPLFHSFLVLYLFRLSLDVFSASFFYPFCCKLSFTCFPIFTGLIIYSFSRLSLNSKYFSSFSLSSQFCSSFFYESSYVFLV